MNAIPSEWAIVSVEHSADKSSLETTDSESFSFHKTELDAIAAAKRYLASGDKLIALLRVEVLLSAKPVELVETRTESPAHGDSK